MRHKFFFITYENNHLNLQRCYIMMLFKNFPLTSQIPLFISPFSALFMLVCPNRGTFTLCAQSSHCLLSRIQTSFLFLPPSSATTPSSTSDFHVVTSNRQSASIIPFHLPAEFERAGISTF